MKKFLMIAAAARSWPTAASAQTTVTTTGAGNAVI